jgi:hypothetical protein
VAGAVSAGALAVEMFPVAVFMVFPMVVCMMFAVVVFPMVMLVVLPVLTVVMRVVLPVLTVVMLAVLVMGTGLGGVLRLGEGVGGRGILLRKGTFAALPLFRPDPAPLLGD